MMDNRVFDMTLARLLILGFLSFFCLSACATKRLYCNFYDGRESVSDRMLVISKTKSGRMLNVSPFWTLGMKFYRTYDEGGQKIISVYKERRKHRYSLFKVDLSGPEPIFLYGYGLYLLAKDFESFYARPFTSSNFRAVNANPELGKYLPEKPAHSKHLSITFLKRRLKCRYINYMEYVMEFVRLTFYYLLAGA